MSEKPARIKTGIAGLDSILFSGIPSGSQVIIAGGPGSGKTLLSFEILYHNAKRGVPVAFITFDEQPAKLLENVKNTFSDFADLDGLISKKTLVLEGNDPTSSLFIQSDSLDYSFGKIISYIEEVIAKNNAKIVVIDSLSIVKLMLCNKLEYRKYMIIMISNLRRLGVTTLLTMDIPSSERSGLRFGQEFFLFDGVVMLYQSGQEDRRVLAMEIVKMRGSNHSWALSPYDITSHGFKIFTIDQ